MARLEASLATNMLDYAPLLGTFTEQTSTRMVLVVPGPPEKTVIFTGSFTYEDPNPGTIDDLPDDFDFGDFNPGDFDFDGMLPDVIQDLLDQFEGDLPDFGDFETYDVWGTITGIERLEDGSSVWVATDLNIPLGTDEGEQSVIDMLGLLTSGFSGADELVGSDFEDLLLGYSGNDSLTGNQGDDRLDGGDGIDTAVLSGSQASYTLTLSPISTTISDRRADGNGTDNLLRMEILDFDTDVLGSPFDLTSFGGPTSLSAEDFESFIELYIAYFNRAPDAVGLNFWGTAFANGTTLETMASLFVDQTETLAAYPEGTSNTHFAETVFNNVLGRTPDQAGLDFWVGDLDAGDVSRDQFILEVLRGAKSELKPELGQAFVDQQLADQAFLTTKTDIGAYFAVHKGMSDVDNASAAMALFDGTEASIDTTVTAINSYYADALYPTTGEFIMQVVGVLDDPFAGV